MSDGRTTPQKTESASKNRARVWVAGEQEVIDVHGWMEFLAREHARELAQEARRQRLFQTLRGTRQDKSSSRSRRLLRLLAHGAADTARKPAAGDGPVE